MRICGLQNGADEKLTRSNAALSGVHRTAKCDPRSIGACDVEGPDGESVPDMHCTRIDGGAFPATTNLVALCNLMIFHFMLNHPRIALPAPSSYSTWHAKQRGGRNNVAILQFRPLLSLIWAEKKGARESGHATFGSLSPSRGAALSPHTQEHSWRVYVNE